MRQMAGQIAGMAVTGIVVLGTDIDVLLAVPLGIFAGALAIALIAAATAPYASKEKKIS